MAINDILQCLLLVALTVSLQQDEKLDREQITDYTLIVGVEDGGTPPLAATANVSILITDINDNSPTFTAGAVFG